MRHRSSIDPVPSPEFWNTMPLGLESDSVYSGDTKATHGLHAIRIPPKRSCEPWLHSSPYCWPTTSAKSICCVCRLGTAKDSVCLCKQDNNSQYITCKVSRYSLHPQLTLSIHIRWPNNTGASIDPAALPASHQQPKQPRTGPNHPLSIIRLPQSPNINDNRIFLRIRLLRIRRPPPNHQPHPQTAE